MTILKRVSDRYLRDYKLPSDKKLIKLTIDKGLFLLVRKTQKGSLSKSYMFRYTLNGKKIEESLGTINDLSLQDARQLYEERRQIVAYGYKAKDYIKQQLQEQQKAEERNGLTFGEAAQFYFDTRYGYRETTLKGIERRLKMLSVLNDKKINDLSLSDGQEIIEEKLKQGYSVQAKKLSKLMKAVIDNLIEHEKYDKNPFEKLGSNIKKKEAKHYKTANPEDPEPDILCIFNTLIPIIPMERVQYMLLLAFTALRPNEARKLQISNVDLHNGILTTGQTKTTDEGYKLSISPEFKKLLKWLIKNRKSGSLVENISAWETTYLGNEFRDFKLNMTCHGWRSASVNWMVLHGVREEVADASLGHSIKRSETVKAYIRTKYAKEKAEAVSLWHKFLLQTALPLLKKREPEIEKYFS